MTLKPWRQIEINQNAYCLINLRQNLWMMQCTLPLTCLYNDAACRKLNAKDLKMSLDDNRRYYYNLLRK